MSDAEPTTGSDQRVAMDAQVIEELVGKFLSTLSGYVFFCLSTTTDK